MSDAIKHDGAKPRISLIPRCAIEQEAKVLTLGAEKYAVDNWRGGFEWRRLIDATLRHVLAFADGENDDPETHQSHLAHARCELGFLMEHVEHRLGTDDRYVRSQPIASGAPTANDVFILTHSGKRLYLEHPEPDAITIEDIAHCLARIVRFNGSPHGNYTVAEHSVVCAGRAIAECPEYALAALMHDASEAYLGDVSTPLKERLANYRAIEDRVMQAIAQKFNFAYPLPLEVEGIDRRVLMREASFFFPASKEWQRIFTGEPTYTREQAPIGSWTSTKAEHEFLKAYRSITGC